MQNLANSPAPPQVAADGNTTGPDSLPYWLVNVSRSQWPAECPDFLLDIPPWTVRRLSVLDRNHRRHNWEEVKGIISKSTQAYAASAIYWASVGILSARLPLALSDIYGILGTNRIDQFQRVPSDLRRYLEYTAKLKSLYGSVLNFIVKERLGWGDDTQSYLKPRSPKPFENPGPW